MVTSTSSNSRHPSLLLRILDALGPTPDAGTSATAAGLIEGKGATKSFDDALKVMTATRMVIDVVTMVCR